MEKKKTRKKWREIRSAVTMMCVMAAMLSSATFAWFTLTSSPTVTGMQMTATSQGGLVVCETSDGTFKNAITLSEQQAKVKELKPVSPDNAQDNVGFREPLYTGGNVNSLGNLVDLTKDGFVAKYTYYIKAESGTGTADVGVIGGDRAQSAALTVTSDVADASGTIVREKNEDGQAVGSAADGPDASNAVRIGLVIGEDSFDQMKVIEVNCDEHYENPTIAPGTYEYNSNYNPVVSFKTNGTVSGSDPVVSVSEKLFEVSDTQATKVTMYIWLEGTDDDCANEIMADKLEAQIQFTIL